MEHINLFEDYFYLIGGLISILIISFTEFRKHPKGLLEVSVILLVGWPIVLPLLLGHFLKLAIRQRDFIYTITTGLCKKCKKEASIECEIGTNRGSIDSIYTEIDCSCRTHDNSWGHFSEHNSIYKYLTKDNPEFTKNKWKVLQINKDK